MEFNIFNLIEHSDYLELLRKYSKIKVNKLINEILSNQYTNDLEVISIIEIENLNICYCGKFETFFYVQNDPLLYEYRNKILKRKVINYEYKNKHLFIFI